MVQLYKSTVTRFLDSKLERVIWMECLFNNMSISHFTSNSANGKIFLLMVFDGYFSLNVQLYNSTAETIEFKWNLFEHFQ